MTDALQQHKNQVVNSADEEFMFLSRKSSAITFKQYQLPL